MADKGSFLKDIRHKFHFHLCNEFTKILLLSEINRRPIGDLSETYRRLIGDPLETDMSDRRPNGD